MSRAIVIEGEPYLALETVAEEFRVDLVVLREAHASGLLGRCVVRETRVLVAVASLDRVATVVRLRAVLGLDLDTVEVMIARQRR